MWGSRKRKEEEEEAATDFKDSLKMASISQDGGIESRVSKASDVRSGGTDIAMFLETYISMMEKMMDSEDFEKMVTPDTIKGMLNNLPKLAQNPQLSEVLDSPQFQDPALLKQTMREGLKAVRQYASQLVDIMKNPSQLEAFISNIPTEFQEPVRLLASGDVDGIKNMIMNLPGIDTKQKNMLSNLLEGNTKEYENTLQDMFSDPITIEAARQQFLADPSMAEMLGIPADILNNKRKWANYMKESMNEMGKAASSGKVDLNDLELGDSLNIISFSELLA